MEPIGRESGRPYTTGRYLARMKPSAEESTVAASLKRVGIDTLRMVPWSKDVKLDQLQRDTAIQISPFGHMLINAKKERIFESGVCESLHEERFLSLPDPQDGPFLSDADCLGVFNESLETWGLQATRSGSSNTSGLTGSGCRVCVVDSGLDLNHPDFLLPGPVATHPFVGATVQDDYGHGTHCAGIICGNRQSGLPRYSVAPGASLAVAKVVEAREMAGEALLIAAIRWAMENHCHVMSMSLQQPVAIGDGPSPFLEEVAKLALDNGLLIVGIAGNHTMRSSTGRSQVNPVCYPANCESIMAVGALGTCLNVAHMSNATRNPGQKVDICAPGTAVHSAFTTSVAFYKTCGGTSVAAPFVAGIAALHHERTGKTGKALWDEVIGCREQLPTQTEEDVGAGLVLAPSGCIGFGG
jgi:subtilisin family serine protease